MDINKFQNYTFFTGKGIEFYQWQGNAPNGAIEMNSGSKTGSSKGYSCPHGEILSHNYFFFYCLINR
jgi:hypothetical protein